MSSTNKDNNINIIRSNDVRTITHPVLRPNWYIEYADNHHEIWPYAEENHITPFLLIDERIFTNSNNNHQQYVKIINNINDQIISFMQNTETTGSPTEYSDSLPIITLNVIPIDYSAFQSVTAPRMFKHEDKTLPNLFRDDLRIFIQDVRSQYFYSNEGLGMGIHFICLRKYRNDSKKTLSLYSSVYHCPHHILNNLNPITNNRDRDTSRFCKWLSNVSKGDQNLQLSTSDRLFNDLRVEENNQSMIEVTTSSYNELIIQPNIEGKDILLLVFQQETDYFRYVNTRLVCSYQEHYGHKLKNLLFAHILLELQDGHYAQFGQYPKLNHLFNNQLPSDLASKLKVITQEHGAEILFIPAFAYKSYLLHYNSESSNNNNNNNNNNNSNSNNTMVDEDNAVSPSLQVYGFFQEKYEQATFITLTQFIKKHCDSSTELTIDTSEECGKNRMELDEDNKSSIASIHERILLYSALYNVLHIQRPSWYSSEDNLYQLAYNWLKHYCEIEFTYFTIETYNYNWIKAVIPWLEKCFLFYLNNYKKKPFDPSTQFEIPNTILTLKNEYKLIDRCIMNNAINGDLFHLIEDKKEIHYPFHIGMFHTIVLITGINPHDSENNNNNSNNNSNRTTTLCASIYKWFKSYSENKLFFTNHIKIRYPVYFQFFVVDEAINSRGGFDNLDNLKGHDLFRIEGTGCLTQSVHSTYSPSITAPKSDKELHILFSEIDTWIDAFATGTLRNRVYSNPRPLNDLDSDNPLIYRIVSNSFEDLIWEEKSVWLIGTHWQGSWNSYSDSESLVYYLISGLSIILDNYRKTCKLSKNPNRIDHSKCCLESLKFGLFDVQSNRIDYEYKWFGDEKDFIPRNGFALFPSGSKQQKQTNIHSLTITPNNDNYLDISTYFEITVSSLLEFIKEKLKDLNVEVDNLLKFIKDNHYDDTTRLINKLIYYSEACYKAKSRLNRTYTKYYNEFLNSLNKEDKEMVTKLKEPLHNHHIKDAMKIILSNITSSHNNNSNPDELKLHLKLIELKGMLVEKICGGLFPSQPTVITSNKNRYSNRGKTSNNATNPNNNNENNNNDNNKNSNDEVIEKSNGKLPKNRKRRRN